MGSVWRQPDCCRRRLRRTGALVSRRSVRRRIGEDRATRPHGRQSYRSRSSPGRVSSCRDAAMGGRGNDLFRLANSLVHRNPSLIHARWGTMGRRSKSRGEDHRLDKVSGFGNPDQGRSPRELLAALGERGPFVRDGHYTVGQPNGCRISVSIRLRLGCRLSPNLERRTAAPRDGSGAGNDGRSPGKSWGTTSPRRQACRQVWIRAHGHDRHGLSWLLSRARTFSGGNTPRHSRVGHLAPFPPVPSHPQEHHTR